MKNNMNLRKGIFRIFLVLSGLWFIILAMKQGIHWRSPSESFLDLIVIGVGVPAVIYFLGKWIGDGFFDKKK